MTAQDLFDFLEHVIHNGGGNLPVYFDTEAREFNYHLASIDKAYCNNDESFEEMKHVCLHEESDESL